MVIQNSMLLIYKLLLNVVMDDILQRVHWTWFPFNKFE